MHNLDALNEAPFEAQLEGSLGEDELNEADELELASELMEVSSEDELDQFLGKLIKRASRGIGKFVHATTGNSLGGLLKNVARRALPFVTQAIGTAAGGPLGGILSSKLNDVAGRAFGLELEGMSDEDQELELARRFVRLGNHAARRVMRNQGRNIRPAVLAAMRRYAPGLAAVGGIGTGGAPVHVHHHHCTCNGGDAGANNSPATATADNAAPEGSEFEAEEPEYENEHDYSEGEAEEPEDSGEDAGELGQSGRWYRRGARIILVGA